VNCVPVHLLAIPCLESGAMCCVALTLLCSAVSVLGLCAGMVLGCGCTVSCSTHGAAGGQMPQALIQQRHSPGASWLQQCRDSHQQCPPRRGVLSTRGGFVNATSHAHQMDCMCWQPELTGFVIAWVPGYQRVPHPVPDSQALHLGPHRILATVPVYVQGGVGRCGRR
jgi:hypothetical protein